MSDCHRGSVHGEYAEKRAVGGELTVPAALSCSRELVMIADAVDVESVIADEVAFAVRWSRPQKVEDFMFVGFAV